MDQHKHPRTAAGNKQFRNFFIGTAGHSKKAAIRVKQMLNQAGLSSSSMMEDYNNGSALMDADVISKHSILFKYSSATTDGVNAHLSMPHLYIGPVAAAANRQNTQS